jgi:muramidase (phage lysozyme)
MAVITAAEAGSIDAVVLLDALAWSEGTSVEGGNKQTKNDGYDVIVTGVNGPSVFTDYSCFPSGVVEVVAPGTRFPKGLYSSAKGRYQFIAATWKGLVAQLGLTDFSPLSQDKAAIQLMRQCGGLGHLDMGFVDQAVTACSAIWASLPGNDYGQGGHSMQAVLAEFDKLKAANGSQS